MLWEVCKRGAGDWYAHLRLPPGEIIPNKMDFGCLISA